MKQCAICKSTFDSNRRFCSRSCASKYRIQAGPKPTGRPRVPAIKRFWKYVRKVDGCWLWIGAVTWDGYGRLRLPDRTVRAHRWAYQRFIGTIPEGMELDHLCKTRCCVNPDHLEPVTRDENHARGDNWGTMRTTAYQRPKKVNRNERWYSG